MIQEIRRLIELAWERLAALLSAAPPGSLQLTGVLGLAALLAGYYHLRGGASPPPRPPQGAGGGSSSSRAADDRAASDARASAQQRLHSQQQQQQPDAARGAAAAPKQRVPLPPAPARRGGAAGASAPSPLAASVRARLAGVKRVTLSAPGVLLEQWDPSDLADAASARSDAIEILREIARAADAYLIAHVPDDVGAATAAGALEAAGVVGTAPGQIAPQRLLLCGTADGKVSIVRQLEPDLHIDGSARTVGDLSRFVPQLLLISPPGGGGAPAAAAAANVETASSLAAFFNPAGVRP